MRRRASWCGSEDQWWAKASVYGCLELLRESLLHETASLGPDSKIITKDLYLNHSGQTMGLQRLAWASRTAASADPQGLPSGPGGVGAAFEAYIHAPDPQGLAALRHIYMLHAPGAEQLSTSVFGFIFTLRCISGRWFPRWPLTSYQVMAMVSLSCVTSPLAVGAMGGSGLC